MVLKDAINMRDCGTVPGCKHDHDDHNESHLEHDGNRENYPEESYSGDYYVGDYHEGGYYGEEYEEASDSEDHEGVQTVDIDAITEVSEVLHKSQATKTAYEECPITTADTYYDPPQFLAASQPICGSAACCTFWPMVWPVLTWSKLSIDPVTVGTEIIVIDKEQGITTTTTEVISKGIVATLNGDVTTFDPTMWLNDGTFDGGLNVPTRSTVVTDVYSNIHTIQFPSAFVNLTKELDWYGSIPIVSANATSCYQNTRSAPRVSSPTFVSTPKMTADPTDPKGLFYSFIGHAGQQVPGGSSSICDPNAASTMLQSWQPTDLIVSVYASCL
ncbi:hypothetical protein Slin14017_G061120 [Septoria linicola]|nr:hypothetical protein Slin14017_G061120 [Septoria linicola]